MDDDDRSTRVLTEVVERFRTLPALRAKASLGLVTDVLGSSDWSSGPGDDTAVIDTGDETLLFAGEAIWPPFVARDPFGAGIAAVVANVNDVAAMGGRSIALVNHVVAKREAAEQLLAGIHFAAGLYRLPVSGGHLTIWEGPPSLSASIVGRVERPLLAVNVAAGQELLVACCVEGRMRADFPYFSSVRERGPQLANDVAALPEIAEEGLVVAAKDVSMPGVLGTLAMLVEPTRCGAVVDLAAIPRPDGVSIADWAFVFPTYGFLLCAPPGGSDAVCARFRERGLACERAGWIDSTGVLRVSLDGEDAELVDLRSETVTGLRREPG